MVSEKLTNKLDVLLSCLLSQYNPRPKLAKATYDFHGLAFNIRDVPALCCLSLQSLSKAAQRIVHFWKCRPWNAHSFLHKQKTQK